MTGETKPNTFYLLTFGACAGMLGQTTSYPLGNNLTISVFLIFKSFHADIVRRRMQTSGEVNCDEYVSMKQTLRKVYVEEGIVRGFFKGL